MTDKSNSEHVDFVEQPAHEAELAGALALANLFSNCVEAFNLIHPQHKWEKDEQLLLSRLGIQQARLLIWGDIVGISSPPKTVTDRAVPRHPSAAYPDLKEPTFFAARDARLDEPETRTAVEHALSAIVDRSIHHTREEMMEKYGLTPPVRLTSDYQQALDTTRLEGFREKYELLQEVAESYAQLNNRRSKSIVQTPWTIANKARFGQFIKLTQEKVDFLVESTGTNEGVDRGMRIDIRSFGWHLTTDRHKTAMDTSKLRLIAEACKGEYPEYVTATEQALAQISRETRENINSYSPYARTMTTTTATKPKAKPKTQDLPHSHAHADGKDQQQHLDKPKRLGLFTRLKSLGRHKSQQTVPTLARSQSLSSTATEPERAKSDVGVAPLAPDDMASLEPVRSRSVGDTSDAPINSMDDEMVRQRLERINTDATVREPLADSQPIDAAISRHDQYHGIARTATTDLRK